MKRFLSTLLVGCMAMGAATLPVGAVETKSKPHTLAVSIYAGWMPWYYANEAGIIKKWADKYGQNITVKYMDYVPSLEAYVAGQADAVTATNMETLDMPSAAGVDSSAVIMGDYSNGNDAVLTRDKMQIPQLKGQNVYLVEKTVSQYLLSRALEGHKMKESDVKIVNVSDSDIAPSFLASKTQKAVVTWNPMVMEIEKNPGITRVFDSSKVPGEIQDLLVVNSKVLKSDPNFARALVGAWYEVMGVMSQPGPAADKAIARMADLAKTSPTEFKGQLKTTAMYYTPKAALDYTKSSDLKSKQDMVRKFCFAHGLLGENAKSVDVVGIQYPDGTIQGDKNNVKMRYVDTFMAEAADGKLSLKK
ncbi:MAG TPA: putative urea ABC transporter substrate-binding protein [Candidatus Obscuribacterales bacterium]